MTGFTRLTRNSNEIQIGSLKSATTLDYHTSLSTKFVLAISWRFVDDLHPWFDDDVAATLRPITRDFRQLRYDTESGAAPYDRDELTAILAADRAAENAVHVLAPIETLFRFSPDRSKGQSIIVRKNDDGTYSAVTDPANLINHGAETSESDESDAESTDEDPT
eukprot:COSAG02_NODE_1299_length_13382_cov_14.723858_5_plen_164_part_00